MQSRTVLTIGLTTTLALAASLAGADEGYRHGRLRFAEPGTTLQRATETESEEAIQNLPFLPGDRIWTDDGGRAEFGFPDGTVVRLDRRGKLDYAGHEEERSERIVLRVWSGSVIVHAPSRASLRFEIETPAGFVEAFEKAVVRVDVDGGDTHVRVYEGEAVLAGVRLGLGERTTARWGEEPREPESFDRFEADDFLQWDQEREAGERSGAGSARYLPEELGEYAGELEQNGVWRYEAEVSSYVWTPRVEFGWQPYSHGRWAWTPYGWTWVPYENWGWAPSHYGRWGHSVSMGWYWMPGRTWGPAWVSWAVGGGYVGWCPLGRQNRPVRPWGSWGAYGGGYGGRAVPRSVFGREPGWNVVRQGELGLRGDVRRRRLDVRQMDARMLQAAESPLLRPTRDVATLRPADPAPRAIRTRATPGDFVRELSVDNKTSIPAPWTRGYGPPPAGVSGARYGTPRSQSGDEQDSRRPSGARPRHGATVDAERAPEAGGVAQSPRSSPRSSPRFAPWFAPRAEAGDANEGGARPSPAGGATARAPRAGSDGEASQAPRRQYTYRPVTPAPRSDDEASPAPRGGAGAWYRPRGESPDRSGSDDRGGYRPQGRGDGEGARPRHEGGMGGGYRPQTDGDRGGYRPQGQGGGDRPQGHGGGFGGGAPRPAPSGGGEARPSGGGPRGGGGGGDHAVARPRGNRE